MKKLLVIITSTLLLISVGIIYIMNIDDPDKCTDVDGVIDKFPGEPEKDYGIDISHHQSLDIWEYFDENFLNITHTIREAKRNHVIKKGTKKIRIDFVYVKASQSNNFQDPQCINHAWEARIRDIKVGLYHFYSIKTSPESQFKNFRQQLNKVNYQLPPAIDFEHKYEYAKTEAQKKEIYDNFLKFYNLVKKECKIEPIVYTNQGDYDMFFKDKNFKLWMPGYSNDKQRVIAQFRYIILNNKIPIDLDIKNE